MLEAPVEVHPAGSFRSSRTLRIVVVPVSLRKLAVTSVAWPGAFHSAGELSSGVPKVSSDSLAAADRRRAEQAGPWRSREVEIGCGLHETTPFS